MIESVARLSGVHNPLKAHHGEMTFLCQACGAKFPFASDLTYHQALHLQEKNFVSSYPKCGEKYKTKPELNCHYNYRHKQKSSKATINRCTICKKTFQRTKYLKEHIVTITGNALSVMVH